MIHRPDSEYEIVASYPKGTELITAIASEDNLPLTQSIINQEATAGPFLALSGTAASVVKDLSITLKKEHPNWIGHNQVIYIE